MNLLNQFTLGCLEGPNRIIYDTVVYQNSTLAMGISGLTLLPLSSIFFSKYLTAQAT